MYVMKAIIIILVCSVFGESQQSTGIQWYAYSPTDKNFSIQFPNKPTCATERVDAGGSKINLTKCLTSVSDTYFFEMKHMVYPFAIDKTSFDLMKIPLTSLYEAMDMKVTETEVKSGNCDGVEIRANSAKTGPSTIHRLFANGRNFYSINLTTEKSDSTFKDLHSRFLASFQVSNGCTAMRKLS